MLNFLPALLLPALAPLGDDYPTTAEIQAGAGRQPGVAARTAQVPQELHEVRLERLSAGIPWPRGIALVDDQLVVVARGRHRNFGGPAPDYEDYAAHLYLVDPAIAEPYEPGRAPSERILANNRVLAEPDAGMIHLYDRTLEPLADTLMNRPYCTLVLDRASRNLFLCAYSGVDVGEAPFFRKNATDAIYRYDLRSERWGVVELHSDAVVPADARGPVISNEHYPHHDPRENAPPHGWLNGPNNCLVVGDWLYAVGKDNHTLARYDLRAIRADPAAGPPPSELVLGQEVRARVLGEEQDLLLSGHSALAADGEWLYLGTRTNSLVVRFPITPTGDLVRPVVGELIAEFEPWTDASRRSADLWDMVIGPGGELHVSCSRMGRVWRFTPDPARPFDGDDQRADPTTPNLPYLDMRALTGAANARASNMAFDAEGRLVLCATFTEAHTERAGAVFRVLEGAPLPSAE